MPLLPKAARPRAVFHPLRVVEVQRLTPAAVAVRLAVPPALEEAFAFEPGQHLTLQATIGGERVRRSYSVCERQDPVSRLGAGGGLRVAAARVEGGRMSTWLVDAVAVGDEIDVLPPRGDLVLRPVPGRARHHVAVAAGSGITPVLSILATALEREPLSRVTLLYGNRSRSTTMFADELDALGEEHGGRLRVVHVISREQVPRDVPGLLAGRLEGARLAELVHGVGPASVDEWWLCGPAALVTGAATLLGGLGVEPARVHEEVFESDPVTP